MEKKRTFRIKGMDSVFNCRTVINNCIKTVDGLDTAHIDLATGRITYGDEACVDESLMREAFGKEGMTLVEEPEKK